MRTQEALAADRFTALSAGLYVGFVILTLATAIGGGKALVLISFLLLGAYLAIEVLRVPASLRLAGLLFCGVGLGLGAWSGRLAEVAVSGVERSLQFLVLFAAITCLRIPTLKSWSMKAVGEQLMNQPPGRRFFALQAGAHLFGSVLNLAGLQLVSSAIAGKTDPDLRRRLALAMTRGFVAASCWSPLFLSSAVVLLVLPDVTWWDVAPLGATVALSLLLGTWCLDRLTRRRSPSDSSAPLPKTPVAAWAGVGGIFLSLFLPIILLVEMVGLAIPIAVGLVSPFHALVWLSLIAGQRSDWLDTPISLIRDLRMQLPSLRNEVLLFTGASILGSGIAAAIDGAGTLLPVLNGGPAIMMIVLTIILAGIAGLHPVIPVVAIGQSLPPSTLGLEPEMMAASMMASWGLATLVSPFSGISLLIGRLLTTPVWIVAWRWNAIYGVTAALLVAIVLILMRHLVGT